MDPGSIFTGSIYNTTPVMSTPRRAASATRSALGKPRSLFLATTGREGERQEEQLTNASWEPTGRQGLSLPRAWGMKADQLKGRYEAQPNDNLPADRRRRESIHSPPAAPVSVDFFENITTSESTTHTDSETSPAVEHCRWDVGLPANWSTASFRRRIEERGIKLPTGIKKAQLVRFYKDNFHTNEGDETTYKILNGYENIDRNIVLN
ncbi:hypothetical protein LSAT2_030341 [Lamellibrachia satsuma]|nr:hypothetical protein LSAT2_030341 [Lamellibrachia satsuma]